MESHSIISYVKHAEGQMTIKKISDVSIMVIK